MRGGKETRPCIDDRLRAILLRVAGLAEEDRVRVIAGLTSPQRRTLGNAWWLWAHIGQLAPPGDWRVWLIRAGRGFGKTRAGAEWVSAVARSIPNARIALIGATADDVRQVMIEGGSGLLAVARAGEQITFVREAGEVRMSNGAIATIFSAGAPERLRGPEHHAAWCDELGKWPRGDKAWDNMILGLRLGDDQRVLVTTTPRSTPLMRRIMALPDMIETRGRTADNPHLPASFAATMTELYGGTRLGRQELDGELLDDHDGALWSRELIEQCRVALADVPVLTRVVVAVDPPAGGEGADEGAGGGDACGIVAVALGEDGIGYVLEDASIAGASPSRWAAAVADCAARLGADRVVAEKNQGGAMVRAVLAGADCTLPLKLVHASRGKSARAEPVSLLYEAGKVRHAGAFPALEDQLCGMLAAGGYAGPGRSPDRADALVWGLSELMLTKRGKARVRGL